MFAAIGSKVWFHNYSGVSSGEVIATNDKGYGSTKVACIRTSDGFTSLEIDSRKMWESQQEATLALAEKKQQEAARLLSEAADLFRRAGGMKKDVAEVTE